MISHAVTDRTLLKKYIPRVKEFLFWARNEGALFVSDHEIDYFLSDFLADQCYHEERPFHIGAECFHGMRCIFP